jgi:hypothetical protein
VLLPGLRNDMAPYEWTPAASRPPGAPAARHSRALVERECLP